ncbi:MAG: hypothetical protein LBQ54_05950 [Planctomycetaceae bacterium]|jgi:hypothetical protein|nr:hypothetical protein [Planctomycetaceae bacterium]
MKMNKREFLKTAAVLGGSLAVSSMVTAQEPEKKPQEPTVLKNTSFFWVRGFNYQPGYGCGHGIDTWCNFKPDIIERELARGKELFPEMTAVRIWLSFDAYLAEPKKIPEYFTKFIEIIGKKGLKVMPVIFNAWSGVPHWGGITPQDVLHLGEKAFRNVAFRFVDSLLDRHASDERIFAWDLCNEPFNARGMQEEYLKWLTQVHAHIKERKEKTCLTIGICKNEFLERIEPICDLFSVHPYFGLKPQPVEIANKFNKPLVGSETGWGSLNDTERVNRLHGELGSCVDRKVGFLIHALTYSRVADLHLPEDGPVLSAGYMACINKDGSLRPGHEMIRPYLKQ